MNELSNKFQDWMEKTLLPVGSKISSQRHLAAVRDGMTVLIPLTIVGGFACLLAVPPVPAGVTEPTNAVYAFLLAWQAWANSIKTYLMIPYQLTMGCLTLYVVASIAYNLSGFYYMNGLNNLISAILVFLVVSDGVDLTTGTINIAMLGAGYMFGGMVVSILVVEINHFFIKHNITIKMPDTVPPNVAAPFNVLIPLIFNVVLFSIINGAVTSLTGAGFTSLVFTIFQPLIKATGSLPSVLLICFVAQLFWFFGIHGQNMTNVVVAPITTAALAANMEAYTAGLPLPYIYAGNAATLFGGWLAFFAMQLLMLTVCKSKQLTSLVKVSFVPSCFNINEPGVFGIPTVLNVYLFIACVLCQWINYGVYYICASIGLVGRFFVTLPFTTPGPVAAFLATMDWKAVVLWFILLVADYFVIMPFIKAQRQKVNRRRLKWFISQVKN